MAQSGKPSGSLCVYTTSTGVHVSSSLVHSSRTFSNCNVVDIPFRNPNCLLVNSPFTFIWSTCASLTMISMTAYYTCQADRLVIVCRSFITFLVDGCDICRLSVLRNSTGGEWCLEYQTMWWADDTSRLLENSRMHMVRTSRLTNL